MSYRTAVTECLDPLFFIFTGPPATPGCSQAAGPVSQTNNYMTLYELDWPDKDDLVETLYFPATSVDFTGCGYDGCPEQTSDWVKMSSSTSSTAKVEAELRIKASAQVQGYCDWYW